MKRILAWSIALLTLSPLASAGPSAPRFQRIITVVLENTSYSQAVQQPYILSLLRQGTLFSNFQAETHPSQGNYIALISGSVNGVTGDGNVNINARHIGDLLEEHGLDWRVYAEQYPGHCFQGSSSGNYVRKHNPFISFTNVQKNPARCAKIVNSSQFDADVQASRLPEYSLYVPDLKNDGHDTGVAFAAKWLQNRFGALLADRKFMDGTLFVLTFDENEQFFGSDNQVFTMLLGSMVRPGSEISQRMNHYSLLRLVEDNWNLGYLTRNDATAAPIVIE